MSNPLDDRSIAPLVQGAFERLGQPALGAAIDAARADAQRRRQVEAIIAEHGLRGPLGRPLSVSEIYSNRPDLYAHSRYPERERYRQATHRETLQQGGRPRTRTIPTVDQIVTGGRSLRRTFATEIRVR